MNENNDLILNDKDVTTYKWRQRLSVPSEMLKRLVPRKSGEATGHFDFLIKT